MSLPNVADELARAFDTAIERFHASPAVHRLLSGEATVREYASLLRSIAHHARENPQIQAAATVWFRGDQRRMVRGFLRHAVSEIDHDALAIADLAALGFDASFVRDEQPPVAAVALNAFAYFQIQHRNPVGYLGYLYFLEFMPTRFGASYLAALDRMGVPAEARSFLIDHATIDVGHNKLMETYLRELVATKADLESCRYALEVTGRLYTLMVEDAFAAAAELELPRPSAPDETARRGHAPAVATTLSFEA